jgi:triacylglycerol esterase/lipase EstA (alpha/beta hydrolase family)
MSKSSSAKVGKTSSKRAAGWGYDSSPTSGIAYTGGGYRGPSPTMRDYERTRERLRRDRDEETEDSQ